LVDAAVIKRFESKFCPEPNSGCFLWTDSLRNIYGQFWDGHRNWYAHRFSWRLANGPIPRGKLVLHRCDVPTCVNPAHLFIGTHKDNANDMSIKGRAHKGYKLTAEQVREIRSAPGLHRDLAKRYGVHRVMIGAIKRQKVWRSL